MKLISRSSTGHGESYTAINFNDTRWYNEQFITYKKLFRPIISQFEIDNRGTKTELETLWEYLVFSGNIQVYEFHSSYKFDVVDITEPISQPESINAILISHNHFQIEFDEKRKEHRLFLPIPNLSPEETQQIVFQLSEVLLEKLT